MSPTNLPPTQDHQMTCFRVAKKVDSTYICSRLSMNYCPSPHLRSRVRTECFRVPCREAAKYAGVTSHFRAREPCGSTKWNTQCPTKRVRTRYARSPAKFANVESTLDFPLSIELSRPTMSG